MELQLKIAGTLLTILSLLHSIFPRYFNWKAELIHLSLMNRQMMQVHTFFIALVVFLMGLLCLTASHELVTTDLGKTISLGIGVFWMIRLIVQFFFYSPDLWKGKLFETIIHIASSFFWAYLSILFLLIYKG